MNFKYESDLGKWIIDTDPGIDDSYAIILAMNYLKEELVLLSIEAGNVGLDQCAINAKKLSVMCNRMVPISKGTSKTISTMSLICFESIHGKDGFFDFEEFKHIEQKYDRKFEVKHHSAIEIIRLSHVHKNLNLLCIGPLTNIALAYMLDPTLPERINKLVIMGGSYNRIGNIKPVGEFNFACDEIAAKIVLDRFKRTVIYCWEPSMKYQILPHNLKTSNSSSKCDFMRKCIQKKMDTLKDGIVADYGAAVAGFSPRSILNSKMLYTDIAIDCTSEHNSAFLVSEKNIFNGEKDRKQVVLEMDFKLMEHYLNEMVSE